MGVIISSAVLPAALTLLWSRQSWLAATLSPPLGLVCSLTGWLIQTKVQYGTLTVLSTGSNYPMLVGNVVALLSPMIFIPVLTYIKPQSYDWESMKMIRRGDDHDIASRAEVDLELVPGEMRKGEMEMLEEQRKLEKNGKVARYLTLFLAVALLGMSYRIAIPVLILILIPILILISNPPTPRQHTNHLSSVLWPMPMYGSKYVFSKKFFTGWIAIGIARLFFSAFAVVLYPLWEGRKSLAKTSKAIVAELSGKGRPAAGRIMQGEVVEEDAVAESMSEKPVVKM